MAERSGIRRQDIAERVSGLAGADRLTFFDLPRIDVSSSSIRRRVREGRPIRYWVPDEVARLIEPGGTTDRK